MIKLQKKLMQRFVMTALMFSSAGLVAVPAQADDTEIYLKNYSSTGTSRPKVLVIIDDSGSMNTTAQVGGEKPPYDPNETYVDAGFDDDRIYWSTNSEKPPVDTNRYFSASSNRCSTALAALETEGNATTKARRWQPASGSIETTTRRECVGGTPFFFWCLGGSWQNVTTTEWVGDAAGWERLSPNDRSPVHVECEADVLGSVADNPGSTTGYPYQPDEPDASNSEAYTANKDDSNVPWGGVIYNFYSAHYLNYWYDDTLETEEKTRLEVVQDVVKELVNSNPAIDFGVEVFNHNENGTTAHGGRIIHAIIPDMTDEQREAMAGDDGLIDSIEARGWTPLCEATYEAFRYLSGLEQVYGDKRNTNVDSPAPDPRAYVGGAGSVYKRPTTACAYSYIILLTDGAPTNDSHANDAIRALTGKTCNQYPGGNCLPVLTEYMATKDLDPDTDGSQHAITYTIGFATDQQLLEDAATNGLGEYFTADTTEELATAFEGAVFEILSDSATFTSPSIAVNSFTRTESLNEVFFAMFQPVETLDWPGNIKRLDIKKFETDGVVELKFVDANELPGVDASTGQIKPTATTIWSPAGDGSAVQEGGVGALLANTSFTQRAARMYTNTGEDQALERFSILNLTYDAYGFDQTFPDDPLGALLSLWKVDSLQDMNRTILWTYGLDTEDIDNDNVDNENRDWVMGDILHSRPVVLNYGALGSHTESDPDLRIVAGTNAGILHMFSNDDGQEDWSFVPKELGGVLTARRKNLSSVERAYGIDAEARVYSIDVNRDGTLNAAEGDKVWLFFGLRRGGRAMYALDVSDPDQPEFMWQITPLDEGFSELGQTWSIPVFAKIPGHNNTSGDQAPRPVLIFGAGYDTNKDNHETLATGSDSVGRGIFIVDAETGELVWSVTPGDDSDVNMQSTDLHHSVAASVSVIDSNGDQLADRIYFGDTGGDLWRVDMPGNALPDQNQDTWFITKLFEANGGTRTTDRRFFSSPDVAKIVANGYPIDALVIGTGDRTNPADVDASAAPEDQAVDNEFYMIRDLATTLYTSAFEPDDCPEEPSPNADFRCSLPLSPSNLYDATENLIQVGNDSEKQAAIESLAGASGWRMTLEGNGEKSLSRGLIIGGNVYFNTFIPGIGTTNQCTPPLGLSKNYLVNLRDATGAFKGDSDDDIDDIGDGGEESNLVRGKTGASRISGDPSIFLDPTGRAFSGQTDGDADEDGNSILLDLGFELPKPYGSYWYRREY